MIKNVKFRLENDCQDEFEEDVCFAIRESGSCDSDIAGSHCKKTCNKCEEDDQEPTTENPNTNTTPGIKT